MAQITREAKADPAIRELAMRIVQGVPEKDYFSEGDALFSWVRDNVRYVRDVRGVETLQWPRKTLEYMQGDCDDQSILLASLIESIGGRARFIAVGPRPGFYVHVLVQVWTPDGWRSLDPIMKVPAGWHPPGMPSEMTEEV